MQWQQHLRWHFVPVPASLQHVWWFTKDGESHTWHCHIRQNQGHDAGRVCREGWQDQGHCGSGEWLTYARTFWVGFKLYLPCKSVYLNCGTVEATTFSWKGFIFPSWAQGRAARWECVRAINYLEFSNFVPCGGCAYVMCLWLCA